MLQKNAIRYERHLDHFGSGTPDATWLPLVGKNGWSLLTVDQKIRYNELERRAVIRHRVREFVFTSGNLGRDELARILGVAIGRMVKVFQNQEPPFIATISKSGTVTVRFDKSGRIRLRPSTSARANK